MPLLLNFQHSSLLSTISKYSVLQLATNFVHS